MGREQESSTPPVPVHLCVFVLVLLMFVCVSWYASYEPLVEGLMEQLKLALMASPLLLLLAVHFLSKDDTTRRGLVSSLVPLHERESLYRAGATPWGVALLLVFLVFMLYFQSQFQERWFPLLAR